MFCFKLIFLLKFDSLALKSLLVIKFICANLALKTPAAKLLDSELVIYLA